MLKVGVLIRECLQGLLVDKKTADKHGIKTIGQFKDPNIAKLFDNDGDGKADLTGGSPGWGSTKTLDHQLKTFGLEKTVTHHQGTYFAMIADTIKRFESGNPVFYYSWTPMWINSIVVPGKDVMWLEMPGATEVVQADQRIPVTGGRFSSPANNVLCANMKFLDANPAAKQFLELVTIARRRRCQNLRCIRARTPADVRRRRAVGRPPRRSSTTDKEASRLRNKHRLFMPMRSSCPFPAAPRQPGISGETLISATRAPIGKSWKIYGSL
jgi:glycine betaine/proline transport system substrate-binding protein